MTRACILVLDQQSPSTLKSAGPLGSSSSTSPSRSIDSLPSRKVREPSTLSRWSRRRRSVTASESTIQKQASTINLPACALLPVAACLVRAEHRNALNLDKQLRPAQNRLDAGRGGQRVQPLFFEEHRAPRIKNVIIAINVPQVASSPHQIVPCGAFAGQQTRDVVECAPKLGREISYMHALSILVDRGSSENQQNRNAADIDSHSTRKRTRLGIRIRLVEHLMIRNDALGYRPASNSFQNISRFVHVYHLSRCL